MQKLFNSRYYLHLLIFLFFLLYFLFPTQNSSIDAYNYAANVKWNHDIFFPHHLFHNFLAFIIIKCVNLFTYQIDVLVWMKFLNAFFAALTLLVFSKILSDNQKTQSNILPMVLIAGSCFGFMRYATENETYIIPIFWSLLSTYFFLKFITSNSKKPIFLSGIFAIISCLFHQIHILWYAGIFFGTAFYNKDYKNTLLFLAPAVLLPIAYYLAFKQPHYEYKLAQNLWQFVFFDYYYGTARVQFGIDNFVLGFISFVRSFIQVHGIIPYLIKENYFYALATAPLLFAAYQLIKECILNMCLPRYDTNFKSSLTKVSFGLKLALRLASNYLRYIFKYHSFNKFDKIKSNLFVQTLIIIFSLHLVFAIFSKGNMEFMVMLPLLLLLIINGLIYIKPAIYLILGISILIWNLSFALIPNHFYDFQNQEKMIQLINNKKDAIFILSDDVLVQNMIYYGTGIRWNTKIYKSPASLKQLNKSTEILRAKIDSCLLNNIKIITDCIDEPKVMSRKQYLSANENELFFKDYSFVKIDSVCSLIGIKHISSINKLSK